MSRTFFLQQNDTKINDFDEGVLILEPFSEAMPFSKFAPFVSNVSREEFLWVAPPDCNAAKLRNECFSLFMLASLVQSKSRHFTRGSQTMENFR